jgi:hypothetical protein
MAVAPGRGWVVISGRSYRATARYRPDHVSRPPIIAVLALGAIALILLVPVKPPVEHWSRPPR